MSRGQWKGLGERETVMTSMIGGVWKSHDRLAAIVPVPGLWSRHARLAQKDCSQEAHRGHGERVQGNGTRSGPAIIRAFAAMTNSSGCSNSSQPLNTRSQSTQPPVPIVAPPATRRIYCTYSPFLADTSFAEDQGIGAAKWALALATSDRCRSRCSQFESLSMS